MQKRWIANLNNEILYINTTVTMKKMMFFLALAGFLAGLTVHVLSVAGIDVKKGSPLSGYCTWASSPCLAS